MLIVGYLEMPCRYATYEFDPALAPLAEVTLLHQAMNVGTFLIGLGTLLWLWKTGQSWAEGPRVDDPDPWYTEVFGLNGREFS